MADRAYTVQEIDELRSACDTRWNFGTTAFSGGTRMGRSYSGNERGAGVEELVRTYMLAGITAKDIYDSDRAAADKAKVRA